MESDSPGMDLSYLIKDYPVRWDRLDLQAQVDAFLALPKPEPPPSETLWVFTFGIWDIWSLAAVPREVGIPAIDGLVADIFSNVERLYQASLDNTSIAFSADMSRPVSAASHREPSQSTQAPAKIFRILIPTVLDPTLVPGWQTDRPELPPVHSPAEQMRNAVTLTDRWNYGIRNAMEVWIKTPDPASEDLERSSEEDGDVTPKVRVEVLVTASTQEAAKNRVNRDGPRKAAQALPPNLSSSRERRGSDGRDMQPSPSASSVPPESRPEQAKAPYPQRDGIAYDLPSYLLEVIMDRQLRDAGIKDASGFGAMPLRDGFLDVTTPCVASSALLADTDDGEGNEYDDDEEYDVDGDEMPSDYQVRARATAARGEPGEPLPDGYPPNKCASPRDHLFYTPFTLGQRAIDEVGRQSAYLVRNNKTMRAFWDGMGKPALSRSNQKPGAWKVT